MELRLVHTADGSHSIYLPELNEHYHSVHGAIQESKHVFIHAGFHAIHHNPLHILEIGLGTGLNALLTLLENKNQPRLVNYTSLEKYPLTPEVYSTLNYPQLLHGGSVEFLKIHETPWEKVQLINDWFSIIKHHVSVQQWQPKQYYHLIYFDAFAPEKQPDMWTEEIFLKLFECLVPAGILVTYCAKGIVKRRLKCCGFEVQTLPGPPGKREMIRAIKLS